MEYYLKQNIDENIVQYVFKADNKSLYGICVKKEINQEQALAMLIEVQEDDAAIIQGLS